MENPDRNALLFLHQLGTDPLENFFAVLRGFSPGSSPSFHEVQLRASSASEVNRVFQQNPEIDIGSRRLKTGSMDHMNPGCATS